MTTRSLSVRSKLTLLVLAPMALLALALPALFWALHRQLLDEAENEVERAERSFAVEMDDDVRRLVAAARLIAADEEVARAVAARDATGALHVARVLAQVHPELDIVLAARDRRVLGDVGPTQAPADLGELTDLVLPATGEHHAILPRGCSGPKAPARPARVVAQAVGDAGWVVVCEPFDATYVDNVAAKLDMQLAVLDGMNATALAARTAQFPEPALAAAVKSKTRLVRDGGHLWAVRRFEPRELHEVRGGRMDVIAAIDVEGPGAAVRRHLATALAALAVVAIAGALAASQLAGRMSRALGHVLDGFRRLAHRDYVRVDRVHTGDELEELAVGFNQMVKGLEERDKLRTTFGKYMTASVLEHLLAGRVALGGETLTATILFCDIRSFTTISERMDAQAVVALLNEYFTEMVGIIMRNGGVVDKYIGDAVMAVFGPPVPAHDDAARALRAALEMHQALARLNERLAARGLPTLRSGIGVHTGEVVAGNIGSEQRMEYTVIGDAVNLASRLETATKDMGVPILISEATFRAAGAAVRTRPVQQITVKGRAEPVMTYEVITSGHA